MSGCGVRGVLFTTETLPFREERVEEVLVVEVKVCGRYGLTRCGEVGVGYL